jgi:hypothetical protein
VPTRKNILLNRDKKAKNKTVFKRKVRKWHKNNIEIIRDTPKEYNNTV